MKLGSLAGARPNYYDRNASAINLLYDAGGIVPHVITIRATTTIAAGKKALVEQQSLYMIRQTAPIIHGLAFATIYVTAAGTDTALGRASIASAVVHTTSSVVIASQATLYAGETYRLETLDASTDGTILYTIAMKGTLFDA
jgi:hypothetical protein